MVVISGAMVASLAVPVSAATVSDTAPAMSVTVPVALASAPSAAQAPLAPRTFGTIGFAGVVKPKPKPKPKPVVVPVVVVERTAPVSRSHTRAALSQAVKRKPAVTPKPAVTLKRKVTVAPPAPSSGGILGTAASLAGIQYIYGGTTTAGFDCSGFTQYVFGKAGINLPRTAEQQRQAATSVSSPQVGDLVFFGSPAYHVGIYAGSNMMWDSPHTGSAVAKRSIWSSSATYGRP